MLISKYLLQTSESCVFCRGRGGMRKRIKMQVRVLERKIEKKEQKRSCMCGKKKKYKDKKGNTWDRRETDKENIILFIRSSIRPIPLLHLPVHKTNANSLCMQVCTVNRRGNGGGGGARHIVHVYKCVLGVLDVRIDTLYLRANMRAYGWSSQWRQGRMRLTRCSQHASRFSQRCRQHYDVRSTYQYGMFYS